MRPARRSSAIESCLAAGSASRSCAVRAEAVLTPPRRQHIRKFVPCRFRRRNLSGAPEPRVGESARDGTAGKKMKNPFRPAAPSLARIACFSAQKGTSGLLCGRFGMFPCPACGWQLYASMYQACSHPEFLSSVGPRRNKKARLTHGPIATKALAASHWLRLASTGCASDWAATDEISVGNDFIRGNRKHRELENRLTCRPARCGVWHRNTAFIDRARRSRSGNASRDRFGLRTICLRPSDRP